MSERTILVWFRNDLRIHDNEALAEAVEKGSQVLPVYCFDPRYFSPTPYGTLKTGYLRARFLRESIADLQQSLQRIGGDLLILQGKPEELLPDTALKYGVSEVFHHREVASEEVRISELVEEALWKKQINLKHFIGHTLYHKEDFPFPVRDIPDTFAVFRKKIERESEVRPVIPAPDKIMLPSGFKAGRLPSMKELGFDEHEVNDCSFIFKGGETAGLESLSKFINGAALAANTKSSLENLYSALSPWISNGSLSAREVYWRLKQAPIGPNAVSALLQRLLWRDYFRFMFKKHENRYSPKGFFNTDITKLNSKEQELFERWKNAETGIPVVDACLRELNQSGYLNHKKRQLAASFLANILPGQWAYGASYFEEKLIDHSPASNWGNWALAAGKGSEARLKQQYDILKQALELDPQGDFVRGWIPEQDLFKARDDLQYKQV